VTTRAGITWAGESTSLIPINAISIPPPSRNASKSRQMAVRRCEATFRCEGGHLGALEWGSAPTNRAALEPHLRVAQRSGSRETPAHNHGWLSFRGVSLAPGDPEPRLRRAEGVSRSLSESEANSPVRNLFRSPYSGKPPPTAARQVKRERLGPWTGASFIFAAAWRGFGAWAE
jgi:hypothetical protein